MAQVGDGPVINEGGDRDDNQVPNQVPNLTLSPQNRFSPNLPVVPGAQPRLQLNWSHFKPKYAGKSDEDM